MPWLKSGDTAATYPKVMQIAGFRCVDPDTIVNEVFGWLTRCMLQGAGHTTDYHLDVGTAYMLGGRRTDELVALCRRAKLLTVVRVDGIKTYKLIEDPEFMHMRLKVEIDAERQRQRDLGNPAVTVPVTLRDGDVCRYCGVLTQWRGKTSARTRTLDHRNGLEEPATVETMVVACMHCNSSRQDDPRWDDEHPLSPPPERPLFGRWAAEYLSDQGHPMLPNIGTSKRPAPAPGADTAPDRVRPATAAGDDTAPAKRPAPAPGADTAPDRVRPATAAGDDTAPAASKSTSKSLRSPIETTSSGSGRVGDGSGSSGSGTAGLGVDGSPGHRRGRRGGRTKGSRGEV